MRSAIVVNPEATMPLRRQIYQEWRKAILTGRFRGGAQVPSSRDLSATLGISRSTVAEAYEHLCRGGISGIGAWLGHLCLPPHSG